jgi:thiamine biosynthesis protein ThiC
MYGRAPGRQTEEDVVHSAIQAAVAAQHVKDMMDQAARDGRAREARLARARRTHRTERRARLSLTRTAHQSRHADLTGC